MLLASLPIYIHIYIVTIKNFQSAVKYNDTYWVEKIISKIKVIHSDKIQSFAIILQQTRTLYVHICIYGKYFNFFFSNAIDIKL